MGILDTTGNSSSCPVGVGVILTLQSGGIRTPQRVILTRQREVILTRQGGDVLNVWNRAFRRHRLPPRKRHRRRLNRADQVLLSKQTYAPASLVNKPELLRSYALLHNEFGGARPWMRPMAEIALALGCSMREARDRVVALEAEGVLVVNRRPGQESEYRLLQESKYIEMPLQIAVFGSHAVCAVWGALRIGLGRGRSALKCATAVTQMAWARLQAITGLGRTAVGKALRWLRKRGWLSRQVVWASLPPDPAGRVQVDSFAYAPRR